MSAADVVTACYRAWGAGDLDALTAAFRPDTAWESGYAPGTPLGGTFTGPAGVREFAAAVAAHVEVLAFEVHAVVGDGPRVVVLGGERARVGATGAVYDNAWVHVWTVDGDAVTGVRTHNDTAAVQAAFRPRAQVSATVAIEVAPGGLDRFRELAAQATALAAPGTGGCLRYAYLADADDPHRVLLVEQWADRAALDAHLGELVARFGPPAPGGVLPAAFAAVVTRAEVRGRTVLA